MFIMFKLQQIWLQWLFLTYTQAFHESNSTKDERWKLGNNSWRLWNREGLAQIQVNKIKRKRKKWKKKTHTLSWKQSREERWCNQKSSKVGFVECWRARWLGQKGQTNTGKFSYKSKALHSNIEQIRNVIQKKKPSISHSEAIYNDRFVFRLMELFVKSMIWSWCSWRQLVTWRRMTPVKLPLMNIFDITIYLKT